jgi:alpha-1,6-mannosyltransferase
LTAILARSTWRSSVSSQRLAFLLAVLAGLVALIAVVIGAAQPDSPFTSKLPGSWIFGVPSSGLNGGQRNEQWLGLLLVYGGIIVLLAAWYCVAWTAPRSLRPLRIALLVWVAPLLVAPPLFSRDVYTYAATGELFSRGINPYRHGLEALRGTRFFTLADPLWHKAHSPYGPIFLELSKLNARLMGDSVFGTVEGYRLMALVGVGLIGVSVPVLARSFGREPSTAFVLAVLNPLVLLYLIGGLHNDALMLGLLLAGIALSRINHPVLGVILCTLGAEIKIPALLGVAFIGWAWAGGPSGWTRRLRYLGAAALIAGLVAAVVSEASGLGWGWLVNLSDPGAVTSWLDPATAVGLALWHALHLFGSGVHRSAVVTASRGAALVVAGVVSVVLLRRSDRYGIPVSLGLSLLAVVFLGPIVWPWYETWGIVVLAFASARWSSWAVVVLSSVACFATIPTHLTITSDQVIAMTLVLVLVALIGAGASVVVRRVAEP